MQIYKRCGGRFWQCAARVDGQRFRESTKEEDLDRAKDVAEEWYLDLRGKRRSGEVQQPKKKEKCFKEVALEYMAETKIVAAGVRSAKYLELNELRLHVHLIPFFGEIPLSEITAGTCQKYIVWRTEKAAEKSDKPPARSTLKQEFVIVRQALRWAVNNRQLSHMPTLKLPYLTLRKKGRRAWFSPEEYKQLYTATRRRIEEGTRPGWKSHYEDLHDYILFMANSGLRPDEAAHLEFRDITIEDDLATGETILVMDIRGKTGTAYAKSMPGVVYPFQRLKERRAQQCLNGEIEDRPAGELQPTDKVFRKFKRNLFNQILNEEGLKYDRDGQPRTAYSLRHTYISTRLMDGANVHAIANNCRTSVKMIEEHYAAHIKDRIDASAINMRKPKHKKRAN